jgi:hypothetical protein
MGEDRIDFGEGRAARAFWRALTAFAVLGYVGLFAWAAYCFWLLYRAGELF